MKKKRTRTYRTKFTQEQLDENEVTLIKKSEVYRWLRVDQGLSKTKIRLGLDVRFDKLFEIFMYPYEEIKLKHVYELSLLLPNKTLFDIMKSLDSRLKQQWFELSDWQSKECETQFDKYKKDR